MLASNVIGQKSCLVAWYKLDGNAIDSSGNGNNGTLYGTALTTDHMGNANSALYFNGTSDHIDLPSEFDYPERTISVWVKASAMAVGDGYQVYDSDNPSLLYGHTMISVTNQSGVNKIAFAVGLNCIYYLNEVPDTWYHVVGVVNTNYLKLFVNEVIIDSLPNNSFVTSANGATFAKIGTNRVNNYCFNGTIEDVRIFNCALTDSEIYQLYASTNNYVNNCLSVSVFPNPASDLINIVKNTSDKNNRVLIYDMRGRLLIQQQFQQLKTNINISDLSPGVYIIQVENNEEVSVQKFIKE